MWWVWSMSWASLPALWPYLRPNRMWSPLGLKGGPCCQPLDSIKAFSTKEIIGYIIGSISSVLYLCSRLPQMHINYTRKSTEGVSYFLFALVILGNTMYGLSVLLKNPEQGQGEGSYIIHLLPWLVGSLGTLSLDLLISIQFLIYRNNAPLELESQHGERAALLDK